MRVESTRWWHAECVQKTQVLEPTRGSRSRLDQKTVLVTGRSSRLEYKRADSTRRCQSVQSKESRLQLLGVDPKLYPSRLEGVRADSKHDDRQHNGYILQPFQNSNSQTAISQVTTVWNFKMKYKRSESSIRTHTRRERKTREGFVP